MSFRRVVYFATQWGKLPRNLSVTGWAQVHPFISAKRAGNMQDTLTLNAAAGQSLAGRKRRTGRRAPGALTYLLGVACLVGVAWFLGRWADFEPGSATGYRLGLAGGIMMLILFLYPLRKHFRFMHGWGPAKYWFAVHMAMGILGPLFILAHSRFQVGSINAGVALVCMSLVAGSGIIGRFIYVKIHHGLYGHRASLEEMRVLAGLHSAEVQSRLHFAPRVEAALTTFESRALRRQGNALANIWAFVTLPLHARWVYWQSARELKRLYANHAEARNWEPVKRQRRLKAARQLVMTYLRGVQNVAHFSTYERLFSLWHVLHVPLVYMLVLSAIAHVVAVHMY